jgi:NTP pyrophosphatase (non-canonical NTP hydrolase)
MKPQLTHEELVSALVKDGTVILSEMSPIDAHLMHMALGIAGESGELVDAVKRYIIYRRPMDRHNLIEELGDMEFFLEGLRQAYNISRQETLQANIDKLTVRYAKGHYTNEQAVARADKVEAV